MRRPAAGRALRWAGWALLWAAAALGLLVSAVALFAALPATRPRAAATVVRWADEALAGRVELDGIAVLPHGGVELRGLRIFDPEGGLVLRVDHARLFVDAFAFLARELRLSAELAGVEVDAARRAGDGELAIARAFAPATSASPRRREERERGGLGGADGWTLRVARLAVSGARIRAPGSGPEPLEASGVGLEARGLLGPHASWIEARASGSLASPAAAPLSIELRLSRGGDRVELQRLDLTLGADHVEAVGEGDLARRTGRLAVTRLGVSGAEAGTFAPGARLDGALTGTLYAEADGAIATAALEIAPGEPGAAGRAKVAAAVRLPPARLAWGLLADVDRLDPRRLSLLAPPGRVTFRGRGAARGERLADLEGRLALKLERSRVRGGELGPAELQASASAGRVEISRLEAAAPGGTVSGSLRWREGSEVAGSLRLDASDLDRLERNLGAVLGRPIPDLEGSGRAEATLSGSSKAPRLDARIEAPSLGFGGLRARGARLRLSLAGPAAVVSGRVQGALERADAGGIELRGVELDASLSEEEGSLGFAANVPRLGSELVRAMLRGHFGPERRWFDLADAAFAWPGTRFVLERPARIGLSVPAVDRLAFSAGEQRIELQGGLTADGALDGRLRLANLELARLPRGLAPAGAALAGLLTVDARASGTRSTPRVDATVGLTGGSAFDVGGLQLLGSLAWDGEAERIEGDLGLHRDGGGAIDLVYDLPVALGGARPYQEISAELHGRAVPLDELVWLAGSYALVSGDLDFTAALGGTVGSPTLRASVSGRNGTWDDLEGLAFDASLEAPGERGKLAGTATLAGAGSVSFEAGGALDLARLLARPEAAVAAAPRAALEVSLAARGFSLAPLAGKVDLPGDLTGRVDLDLGLAGTFAAPRGTVRAALDAGAGWGARAVAGRAEVALAGDRTGATMELRLAGEPAARLDGTIDLPPERLLDRAILATAPFHAALALPRSDLAAWGGEIVALAGAVEGSGTLRGTLAAPQADLRLAATDAAVMGRPLGALTVDGRYGARRASVIAELRPPAGGTLHADAALDRALGLGAGEGALDRSPAEVHVRADRLGLGFLPALAPGIVRAASGTATIDLAAAGPLGELHPRGALRVEKGRLAIAELGEWTDAAIEAVLEEDTIRLDRFDVRKGKGTLSIRGAVKGLARPGVPAELEATLKSDDFGVERAGMELARFDLGAEARGQLTRRSLTLGLVVPQAEVKLPKRIPRTLQEVEQRRDITVGRPKPERIRRAERAQPRPEAEEDAGAAKEPFKTIVHLVAPRRFRVRADQPRLDVELKADAIFAFAGSRQEATGTIEAIRGQGEPLGGRVFVLERGKVTFTGNRIMAGQLDVAALWDNPTAKVHATVAGTLARPELHLSSEPPLEEAQIAMLIATGRTEVKAGTGGVDALAASDAGLAAAGAVVMGAFKDLLSDKLPVDSVSVDSTALSAGKYLTDRIYVGYVRRFDAKPEKGENPDEVRVEYQLAPGWQVETRYGSGQSGGASIVWTRNY